MSNCLYDFLTESFIFCDKYIEENYSSFSDDEIKKELKSYREYSLKNINKIYNEINSKHDEIKIQIGSLSKSLPDESLLKQLALYVDKVIISDPIFKLLDINENRNEVIGQYLGIQKSEFNRRELVDSVKYMKNITPMICGDYVKFAPLSYIHELPEYIPICYSENNFSDVLPKKLLNWFHKNAEVLSLYKTSEGWMSKVNTKLRPSRGITIQFKKNLGYSAMIYFLFENKFVACDESTGKFELMQNLPNTPPKENEFLIWVDQSINRAAEKLYNDVYDELYNCTKFKSMYLIESPFIGKMLNKTFNNNSLNSDIANLVMKLDVPIIQDASVEKIMNVRQNDGESFYNFRVELKNQLKELRLIDDAEILKKSLENVSQGINEVQINEINKKVKEIKKSIIIDSAILIGNLAVNIQTGGNSVLASMIATANGIKNYRDYNSKVKGNPSYFLWKIKHWRW